MNKRLTKKKIVSDKTNFQAFQTSLLLFFFPKFAGKLKTAISYENQQITHNHHTG